MATTTAPISQQEKAKNMKALQVFSFEKISENLIETIITLIVYAFTVAFINIVQGITIEFAVYIVLVFLLVMLRRLTQDFDSNWTNDELGNWLIGISKDVDDIKRMVRDENILTASEESDLEQRVRLVGNGDQ